MDCQKIDKIDLVLVLFIQYKKKILKHLLTICNERCWQAEQNQERHENPELYSQLAQSTSILFNSSCVINCCC